MTPRYRRYYKWADRAAYQAALASLGWANRAPPGVELLESGTVSGQTGYYVAAQFATQPPAAWDSAAINVAPAGMLIFPPPIILRDLARLAETQLVPEMFGAVGGGIRDDYVALQLMMDVSASTGRPCRLSPGVTYRTARQFALPSNLELHGAPGAKIVASGLDFTANTANSGLDPTGCVFLAYNKSNVRILSGLALQLTDMGLNSFVNGFVFRGVSGGALSVECWGGNGGNAITLSGGTTNVDVWPSVWGWTLNATDKRQTSGIEIAKSDTGTATGDIRIWQPRIRDMLVPDDYFAAYGFQTDGVNAGQECHHILIEQPDIRRVGEACDLWGDDIVVNGGWFEDIHYIGFKLIYGARRMTIKNTVINGFGHYGAIIGGGSNTDHDTSEITVLNVTTMRGGFLGAYPGSGVRAAFSITDALTDFDAANCSFINCVSVAPINLTNGLIVRGRTPNCRAINLSFAGDHGVTYDVPSTTGTRVQRAMGTDGSQIFGSTGMLTLAADGTAKMGSQPGNRYMTWGQDGFPTMRADDSSLRGAVALANGGVTAAGQGVSQISYLGVGGALATPVATAIAHIATDDWTTATKYSAKITLSARYQGNFREMLSVDPDPTKGIAMALILAAEGGFITRSVKVGLENSGGAGKRMLVVDN